VGILKGFREKLADKALKKLADARIEKPCLQRLDEAASVGILFNWDKDGHESVSRLLGHALLKGRKVRILGFKPYRPAKGEVQDDHSFSVADTNRLFKPASFSVQHFLSTHYDIVLDLSTEDHYPLLYVLAEVKAGLKVSLDSERKMALADLMIRMQTGDDPSLLFGQMTHYLEQINKSNPK